MFEKEIPPQQFQKKILSSAFTMLVEEEPYPSNFSGTAVVSRTINFDSGLQASIYTFTDG